MALVACRVPKFTNDLNKVFQGRGDIVDVHPGDWWVGYRSYPKTAHPLTNLDIFHKKPNSIKNIPNHRAVVQIDVSV